MKLGTRLDTIQPAPERRLGVQCDVSLRRQGSRRKQSQVGYRRVIGGGPPPPLNFTFREMILKDHQSRFTRLGEHGSILVVVGKVEHVRFGNWSKHSFGEVEPHQD